MKPTFALDLTRDSIALLHRTPKGWLSIGEVAFGAPDMDEALDYLRKTALGLSPMGMATKIVLPNSQILYTDVHAPGPSREDKRRQIAAALEGQTPYAVEDLVFDWSGKGQTVKVAVVARETLQEAEDFAASHRLNPVSFVAIPEDGYFVGEPWFGPTNAAESLLAPGEAVDRDREAVTILHRELPADEPQPAAAAPEPEAVPEVEAVRPVTETTSETVAAMPAVEDEAPLPGLEEALNSDLPVEAVANTTLRATDGPVDIPPAADPTPAVAADPELTPERAAEAAAAEVFADSFARTPEPEVDEAPFAHVTDPAAFPDELDEVPAKPPAPKPSVLDDIDDDLPPAPPSAAMVAFASRRAAAGTATPPAAKPVEGATRSDTLTAAMAAARLETPAARPAPAKGFSGLVTAPSIPGTRAKPKGKLGATEISRPVPPGPTTVKSPARPGGTFGTAAPPRNRSGVVLMVLIALLLLFLAAMAAVSSFYLARMDAPDANPSLTADVTVPAVDDEILADMEDPEGLTGPLPEAEGAPIGQAAELATESAPINLALGDEVAEAPIEVPPEDLAVAEPDPTEAADAPLAVETAETPAPEPAPGTAVTTELTAAQPPIENQDEIFLSAMDAPPPALDALALPAPAATVDALPDAPMPPPAFGTVYRFGPDGLLVPTPEGIVSPDGVMLFAGPPPLVPPSRSEAAAALAAAATPVAAAAPQATADPAVQLPPGAGASLVVTDPPIEPAAPEAAVAPAPADPAMAGFRPRSRPEGLVPATPEDDASLTTDDATEFAGRRPLPRPATVVAAASASRPASPADLGAQGASLAAQAEAELAAAAALEAANPSIVAISKRPAARPRDLSDAVEAAVAAAVREPAPEPEVEVAAAAPAPDLKPEELEEADEPETARAAPSIPTKASVAKQATFVNAINLSKMNLIGTYGTDSKRYALVRQANGRYKKVTVGDKIDGGTIKAITETEVRYQKGGKLLSLKMPKA
ncbi:MAG: hypothetical protein MUE52_12835 [Tabrizicola sp.]|jgi:hypothetical protein|nr:hypothetical protein [Tabrizicola sp.]